MFRYGLVLAAVSTALAGATARADSLDSGKRLISKLMVASSSKASAATVRVRVDNKDAILGTVMDKDGYILTKGSELKGTVSVRLSDGSEYDAKTIGYHELTDLALLKIDTNDLTPIPGFVDAKDAIVGNWVAVAGPEAEPLAVGIVSAESRRLYGEERLIDNLNKGFLGITAANSESEGDDGIRISSVSPGGGAAFAKLKKDDIILAVAGKPVKKFDDLKKILDKYKPDETVMLLIRRGEEEKEYKVKLVKRAKFDRGDFQNTLAGELSSRRTGFPKVIMHDTSIKPSECGGPLVDLDGKVLGINIARAGRVETWTLPADIIKPVYADLKAGKYPLATDEKPEEKKPEEKKSDKK